MKTRIFRHRGCSDHRLEAQALHVSLPGENNGRTRAVQCEVPELRRVDRAAFDAENCPRRVGRDHQGCVRLDTHIAAQEFGIVTTTADQLVDFLAPRFSPAEVLSILPWLRRVLAFLVGLFLSCGCPAATSSHCTPTSHTAYTDTDIATGGLVAAAAPAASLARTSLLATATDSDIFSEIWKWFVDLCVSVVASLAKPIFTSPFLAASELQLCLLSARGHCLPIRLPVGTQLLGLTPGVAADGTICPDHLLTRLYDSYLELLPRP